jgi:hypothetical protein
VKANERRRDRGADGLRAGGVLRLAGEGEAMKTFYEPNGEMHIQWIVLENASDPGFRVEVAIDDKVYGSKKDPAIDSNSRDRIVRNVIVSAIEHELSLRMGLVP